jgi:GAF domain-containing protein
VGSDPQELAATLRELVRLDPVELGREVVLERIVQAAASGCDSSGGVGLLLLGADGQLRYVVAAGRPRRLLAGTQVRLAEGPSVDAFLQAASVSSGDLAAESRWPDFGPLALAAGIRAWLSVPVHQRHGPIGVLDFAHTDPRPWRSHDLAAADAYAQLLVATLRLATAQQEQRLSPALRFAVQHDTRIEQAVASSCSANGSTRPLRSSCSVSKPRSRANRSEPSPNASWPAPAADRHPSATRVSPLGGRSQIPATGIFGQLVQTATLPEPCG